MSNHGVKHDEQAERPELMRLLDNARQGDVIIVWKLDRLARSLRQLIDTTVLLNERGVELHSLTENINTTTPSGQRLSSHLCMEECRDCLSTGT